MRLSKLALALLLGATTFACAAQPTAKKDTDETEQDDEDEDGTTSSATTPAPSATTPPADTPPAVETPAPTNTFLDDFSRPDGLLGNDWVERTPGMYRLANGQAEQFRVGRIEQLLVLRPATEDASDVEVSVDVMPGNRYEDPGLFARASVDPQGRFTGYSFYFDGGQTVVIDRANGSNFTPLAHARLARGLVGGQGAKLTFKVTGAGPVILEGTVTDMAGMVLAKITAMDQDSQMLLRGSTGFGSAQGAFTHYDNFQRVTLAP